MDCEFIRKVRHMLHYEDFQDIQFAILSSLSFEEQERIEKLITTPDRENRRIGKSILVTDINQSLIIHSEMEIKMKRLQKKINECVQQNDVTRIEYLEEDFRNYHSLYYDVSDFISYLLSMAIKYDWKTFKDPKWYELIEKYLPPYDIDRKVFEKHIHKPKGRPRTEVKSLHYFLTYPKKDFKIIPELRKEYINLKPGDIHYMVFQLYKMKIFNSKVIDDKSSLHRCLVETFGSKTTGSRAGLSRKLNELITEQLEPDRNKFKFHKQKIDSILAKINK